MTNEQMTSYGAFGLRLSLGVLALSHGLLKLFVFTLPGTVQYFASLGYPAIFAYGTVGLEIFGGLALILGLFVRPVALLMVPLLIGATMTHWGNGWLFSWEGGGWEFPAFWGFVLIIQAMLGAGAFSLQDVLQRRILRQQTA